jgi:hypothetical protein
VEELHKTEWKPDNISIEMEVKKSLKTLALLDLSDKVASTFTKETASQV